MRYLLLLLSLQACSTSEATAPATVERNLVCERVKLLNETIKCDPEMTDEGDMHTHTARVHLKDENGKPVILVYGLNAGQLAMTRSALEVVPQARPEPEAKFTGAETKPAAKVKK